MLVGLIPPLPNFSNVVHADEKIVNNSKVLSDDFDLQKEVENMPSVHEMTTEERELFNKLVQEEAELNGGNNKELYSKTLTNFFDESSGHAYDLEYASEVLDTEKMEKHEEKPRIMMLAAKKKKKKKKKKRSKVAVSVKLAGSIFNVSLGFAAGGGVGAIQAYIVNKGKKEAKRIFTKTIVSKIKAWGAPKLAATVGIAVGVAMDYSNIGGAIAKQIDKRDKHPNNGWIDIAF
jgi:hypothetical protein